MFKPCWQASFDRQRYYDENIKPIVSVVLALVAVLLAAGGVLWVYSRYMTHGRDPEAVVVPEYLTEPPSDERPGVVGVLLDERADMKDIMATLIDLARRGYLVIEQTSEGGIFGMFEKTEFRFHRTDKSPDALRPRASCCALFRGDWRRRSICATSSNSTSPASRRNSMPRWEWATSRAGWRPYATASAASPMVLAALLFAVLSVTRLAADRPPAACVTLVGLAMSATCPPCPPRPRRAPRQPRWKAFRCYLMDIDRYTDVEAAAQKSMSSWPTPSPASRTSSCGRSHPP